LGSGMDMTLKRVKIWERVNNLLKSTNGKIEIGGEAYLGDLYISPTVIIGVAKDELVMQDELFGSILPIMIKATTEAFKTKTSTGPMVSNDAIVHLSVESLPVRGVSK
jgi:hypothetical protein